MMGLEAQSQSQSTPSSSGKVSRCCSRKKALPKLTQRSPKLLASKPPHNHSLPCWWDIMIVETVQGQEIALGYQPSDTS